MARASQSTAILFHDNWGDFGIHFILHWNKNETSPVFSRRVVLIPKALFFFFSSNLSLSFVFTPEMTRKAALNLRNQKILPKSLSPSATQCVPTHAYAKMHAKQESEGAAAFPSQSNAIWLLWSTLPLTVRCQTPATFWKWVWECAPRGSNFLVSKHQSS